MDFIFDWDNEADRFSFDDSERFEEESMCSWMSESESLNNNWRGWKRQNGGQSSPAFTKHHDGQGQVLSLVELASQTVAHNIPYGLVEKYPHPIPEPLQLRITFWSFPDCEEDIRLYSCLANGSAEEFQKGDHLYKAKAVKNALQIGFHLSATVEPQNPNQQKGSFKVAIFFDRRRISSCSCTCNSGAYWCSHVVAVCLFRINQSGMVTQRAPVSESLSRLQREQLQKFAQYLISEMPQEILPIAQTLLDQLLSAQECDMNKYYGAPDPTAGPSDNEETSWCLDEKRLHENVKKTLVKFCVPSPVVFSDVNFLTQTASPAAAEWQSLLRPLRGREPEGMWNLLSIAREMFRRSDHNAIPLLEIITDEVLQCEQILIWWFVTKITSNNNNQISARSSNNTSASTQHAASSLCDEIVSLWRLAALNPKLSPVQKEDMCSKFKEWHISTIEKVKRARSTSSGNSGGSIKKSEIESFSGFKPGIEACILQWEDYHIPGVTHLDSQRLCQKYRFNRNLDPDAKKPSRVQPMAVCSENLISTDDMTTLAQATNMLNEHHSSQEIKSKRHRHPSHQGHRNDGAVSSGSEGFCELERGSSLFRDSDSGSEMKESYSRGNSLEDVESFGVFGLNHKELNKTWVYKTGMPTNDNDDNYMELEENARVIASEISLSVSDGTFGDAAGVNGEQSSESQVSGDEYSMYFYDRAKATEAEKKRKEKSNEEPNYFAGLRSLENRQDMLFARAEALHAHGHTKEACELAQQLAEELLSNPPDLLAECAAIPSIKGKRKKLLTNITMLASSTVLKAAFLCSVLLEEPSLWHLAFQMGMFVLEMPRPPAFCKAMEVKLAYQEMELLTLLKKIPLGPVEMAVLRQRAEQLKDGTIKSRGEALLPLTLAGFIFDALCLGACTMTSITPELTRQMSACCRQPGDEKLGFEGCVASLGMKANVSEADHPLLCESIRKQRGELAMAMLIHYKDDNIKLSKIMDKLLDKEVHPLYKAPSLVTYLTPKHLHSSHMSPNIGANGERPDHSGKGCSSSACGGLPLEHDEIAPENDPSELRPGVSSASNVLGLNAPGARPKTTYNTLTYGQSRDTDSSTVEEEGDDYKALEAKLRCMALKKKPSQGMAAIDSSAPETTSSDNSPTLVRRVWGKHKGPGSDSGSSGDSDSLGSSSSGDKGDVRAKIRDDSPQGQLNNRIAATSQFVLDSRSSTPNMKGIRFKGKSRIMPTIPNQPSEASAHWMWELAKMILNKAGGNSSTSQFIQPSNSNQHTGPHRNLQLCSFQIGLYALGLQNCVAPNWLSRTYSSHVSWIAGQAMEIGSAAIHILIDTWEGHLTPTEVASLADRASRGRDHNIAKAAAELALSCLPQAQALNPAEVQRALLQCKEQSKDMLEKACLAVESASKGGGVYPEVLFNVAKMWYELSEEAASQSLDNNHHRAGRENRPLSAPSVSICSTGSSIQRERSSPGNAQMLPFNNSSANNHVGVTGNQILSHNSQLAAQAVMLPFAMPPVVQPSPHHPHPPLPHQQPTFVQPAYNIVQQIPFVPPYSQSIPMHVQNMNPYLATYTYNNPIQFSNIPQTAVYASTHYRPMAPGQGIQVLPSQSCQITSIQGILPPQALPFPHQSGEDVNQSHASGTHHILNPSQAHYLHTSFRVGLLAMETLARRVHDDRPQTKYARNPTNGDDVKWLLNISMKLGTSYLQQFTASVVTAVVSPFLLYDIAIEAAHVLARNNPLAVQSHLRSGILHPVVQKCLQMFIQCAHQRIHHINTSDYDDFVSIICSARNVFYITPGGMIQFQELLQSLRRTKSCRKDLWQRIMNGLATPVSL